MSFQDWQLDIGGGGLSTAIFEDCLVTPPTRGIRVMLDLEWRRGRNGRTARGLLGMDETARGLLGMDESEPVRRLINKE